MKLNQNEWVFDKRVMKRYLENGKLQAKDVDNHLQQLVDQRANCEDIMQKVLNELFGSKK